MNSFTGKFNKGDLISWPNANGEDQDVYAIVLECLEGLPRGSLLQSQERDYYRLHVPVFNTTVTRPAKDTEQLVRLICRGHKK